MNIRRDYGKTREIIGGYYVGAKLTLGRNKLWKGEMRQLPEGCYPRWDKRKHPYANATVDLYLGPIQFHAHCNNEDSYIPYWVIGPKTIGSHPSNIRIYRGFISFEWVLSINDHKYKG